MSYGSPVAWDMVPMETSEAATCCRLRLIFEVAQQGSGGSAGIVLTVARFSPLFASCAPQLTPGHAPPLDPGRNARMRARPIALVLVSCGLLAGCGNSVAPIPSGDVEVGMLIMDVASERTEEAGI